MIIERGAVCATIMPARMSAADQGPRLTVGGTRLAGSADRRPTLAGMSA